MLIHASCCLTSFQITRGASKITNTAGNSTSINTRRSHVRGTRPYNLAKKKGIANQCQPISSKETEGTCLRGIVSRVSWW